MEDKTIQLDLTVEDSAVFVMGLGLIAGTETSLALVCDKSGIKTATLLKENKKKEYSVYAVLIYPRANLINYSLTVDEGNGPEWVSLHDAGEIAWCPNLDTKVLLEKNKNLKATETFRLYSDKKDLYYSINDQGSEKLPCVSETGTNLKLPDYQVDRDAPTVTLSKKEYTNLCGRLKTLKTGNAQVKATFYDHGIKFIFNNYADPNESEQLFGDCSDEPLVSMPIDIRSIVFPAAKLAKLTPDRSPIKFYQISDPLPGLLINLPVGASGFMDILCLVNTPAPQ